MSVALNGKEIDNISTKADEFEDVHRRDAHAMPPTLAVIPEEELARMEKKLVRKIDARLMPAVIIMYLLNYIDRNNIASARLGGLEEDLGLQGSQYQTCTCSSSA